MEWTGPLSTEEQAMIDAAWQTHRDALDQAAQQPPARPKTLLDGFGEATDEVLRLRTEITRLRDAIRIARQFLIAGGTESIAEWDGSAWDAAETLRAALGQESA